MGNSLKKANSNKTAVKHQNLSPKKVIMVGLDETGKTTILERISNDITMDEPVPGFTIETCKYKNLSINAWNIAANNDKIRSQWNALLHLVYQDTDGIIFVIDSCDRIRIDNSEGFFWDTVRRHFDMLLEQDYVKNATLLILANKEDKSDAMNINTISEKLELNTLRNRQWFITSCSAINENDYGVNKGFEWLLDTLNNNKYCIQSELKSILLISGYIREIDEQYRLLSSIPIEIVKFVHLLYKNRDYDYNEYKYYGEYDTGINNSKYTTILLMQFINRKDCDGYIENDETFIDCMNGKLELNEKENKWNHYNFMRMIWIFFAMYDRRNGLKQIWKYTPYNVTKTYFWSQLIYFGMNRNDFAKRDFQYFLIVNPSFSNDYNTLMSKYYSFKLLDTMDKNKNEMILPDKMSLPSLITNIKKFKVKVKVGKYKRFTESDQSFLKHFENKTYKSWEGHTSFLRVIWCYINILNAQHTSIIQKKWKEFDSYNYTITKTYFWIHEMRYYILQYKNYLDRQKQINDENKSNDNEFENEYSFEGFLNFCSTQSQCRIEYSEWYKEFYSQKLLKNTPHNKLVLPDLKQMPSI